MPAKLYKLNASPPARAAMMACEIFKVPVEMVNVDFVKGETLTPEYLKMNPLHTIPVFADGDLVIHNSHAILIYLAEVYGKDSSFYPKDVKQRALINQKLFFDDGVLFAKLRNITYPAFALGQRGLTEQQLKDLEECYEFLEEILSRQKYIALDHITIADVAAYATVFVLDYILPLNAKYSKLSAWLKEMDKQPYAVKHKAEGLNMLATYINSPVNSK
ncbi:glutathione S-transferase 1-like [Ostrinia nubilalis]|uniref:glutathione S-transferase 1-like n=1 Tax=Ostrinia furnacalis TaxID=93504 RepID=UPI00103FB506|nr:glutathione S-transferase 1-like [Ostrinia furnacalis]